MSVPRIALIHYWLVNMRGGEHVLEALCRMYPQADIYTHVVDKSALSPLLQSRHIHTTFIQRLPYSRRLYRHYLPLMPLALEQLDLSDYDLVISSESGPAKGVLTRADCTHVCYCHSPMRYLWDLYPQYIASAPWATRQMMRLAFSRLRLWDVASAHRVDHFVANSATVARRIRKHWRREAAVVHPPVDVQRFAIPTAPRSTAYLCLGQLVEYKNIALAVQACTRLQVPLIVAGDGPQRKVLKALAGPTVRFVGHQSQEAVARLYQECRALLFPGEEDFGMVPVEAMATGSPVIALGRGGATETVIHGETGLFFETASVDALCEAILAFEARRDDFDPLRIRARALEFDETRFVTGMRHEITKALTPPLQNAWHTAHTVGPIAHQPVPCERP